MLKIDSSAVLFKKYIKSKSMIKSVQLPQILRSELILALENQNKVIDWEINEVTAGKHSSSLIPPPAAKPACLSKSRQQVSAIDYNLP